MPKAVHISAYTASVIGGLMSIGLAISYIGVAWNGFDAGFDLTFVLFAGLFYLLVGIFLFPRTVGVAVTPTGFITPIAFVIALFRLSVADSFAVLGLGFAALLVGWLIGKLRPDATGY